MIRVISRSRKSFRREMWFTRRRTICFTRDWMQYLDKEFRRFPLDLKVYAYPGAALVIDAEGFGMQYLYESEEILEEAVSSPTSREQVEKHLARLGETVFVIGELEFESYNAFIPAKLLNSARRQIVQALYDAKLAKWKKRIKQEPAREPVSLPLQKAYLTATVTTQEQYDVCKPPVA